MVQPLPDKAFPVSWDQFHRDSRALAWRLNGAGPFEALVTITRGGLVPAAIVARELGLRLIENGLARELGGDTLVELLRRDTHSCYRGRRDALHDWGYGCGDCPACDLRRRGWRDFVAASQGAS